MQILIISNKVPYPANDGGAIATLNLAKGFALSGNKVSMLAMNTNKHYCDINCVSDELKKIINFYIVDVPAKITPQGLLKNYLFSKLPYNAERFIVNNFKTELVNHLKQNTYDVIQLEGLYVLPYVDVIRKYSKALISYRAHNVEHEIWERVLRQEISTYKKIYLKSLIKRLTKFEKKLLNTYDVIVPITERDEKKLNNMGNKKLSFVSKTGIDFDTIKINNKNTDYPSIFHIGALDWAPNQEGLKWFFNKVWQQVINKKPDLKIYIAGRNAPKNFEYFLKSQKNTIYLGEIDNAHKFINSKAVMIVPLFSGSGLRIKIIEGMSLGKVIISKSIGAEGINITNKKNILIANNSNDFVNNIVDICYDYKKYNYIKNNAIEFSRVNFDINKISNDLVNFYRQNLNKKN